MRLPLLSPQTQDARMPTWPAQRCEGAKVFVRRCDLSDFCRKFLPHSSGFPAAFSLIFLIFLTHCVAETHLVLPCAQVHVMRRLMSSAMVVVWIVAGAAQAL